MKASLLEALNRARAAHRPAALATALDDGEQVLLFEGGDAPAFLADEARAALRDDVPRLAEAEGRRWFVHPFNPPLRLVLVGAVHISQPLVRMAGEVGFRVRVIDPREAFARAARFPDVEVITEWPDEVLAGEPPDARTAVVTLTHDPKLDDPALQAALRSPAFYVGALGSRRTHAGRLERLRAAGFDEAALRRIHGPVGLPLGARSPAEIAVSILADLIRALRQPGLRR